MVVKTAVSSAKLLILELGSLRLAMPSRWLPSKCKHSCTRNPIAIRFHSLRLTIVYYRTSHIDTHALHRMTKRRTVWRMHDVTEQAASTAASLTADLLPILSSCAFSIQCIDYLASHTRGFAPIVGEAHER